MTPTRVRGEQTAWHAKGRSSLGRGPNNTVRRGDVEDVPNLVAYDRRPGGQDLRNEIAGLFLSIAPAAKSISIARGSLIYMREYNDVFIYLIESGRAKVVQATESGKNCVLGIYGENDILGLSCLGDASDETAIAVQPTRMRRMLISTFLEALQTRKKLAPFVRYLASRLTAQQTITADMVTLSSECRLARTLVRLAREVRGAPIPYTHAIREWISCQELSEMVGTTRSRIGYFLKRFQQLEFIKPSSRCFYLIDTKGLARYTRQECERGKLEASRL